MCIRDSLLSVQFFRDGDPMCSLAVWACAVPPSVMQHAVRLGRDSWMRFNTRSYRALPPRPNDKGMSGYATDPTVTDDGFHLLYDGTVRVT